MCATIAHRVTQQRDVAARAVAAGGQMHPRGYKTGTSARARAGTRVHRGSSRTSLLPARKRPRVPANRRVSLICPSLVMKGSPFESGRRLSQKVCVCVRAFFVFSRHPWCELVGRTSNKPQTSRSNGGDVLSELDLRRPGACDVAHPECHSMHCLVLRSAEWLHTLPPA